MKKLFGTDGIRGLAGQELTAETALLVGRVAVWASSKAAKALDAGERPLFLVGKDPRESSDMLEAAVSAGLSSAGAEVWQLGVVPTPAVSALILETRACGGVMISASHNPYPYNGLKVFDDNGIKLDEDEEAKLEALIASLGDAEGRCDLPGDFGRILSAPEKTNAYLRRLLGDRAGKYTGMHVALDCANGSTSAFAKSFFEALGCQVTVLSSAPNGRNINQNCGSTHMDALQDLVQKGGFDAGFAFDGDGDRCLALDEAGELIDGDKILAVLASARMAENTLPNNRLITTVMANFGFMAFAKEAGITALVAGVGDRKVLSLMQKEGALLGGEQSGHVISADWLPTGDGMLTASLLLDAMYKAQKPLSALASVMQTYPQILRNVPVPNAEKEARMARPALAEAIKKAETELDGAGRVLVRPSGTEPLIRVMAEGADLAVVERLVDEMAKTIED
jgi:phosphoglucosamine mutase